MSPKLNLRGTLLAVLILGLGVGIARAQDVTIYSFSLYYIGDIKASEYNMLPTFCRNLATTRPPDFPAYVETAYDKAMLEGISGKHHFCKISVLKARYLAAPTAVKKRGALEQIVNEADYVIRNTTPNAPLRIKAHLEKANALVIMKQDYQALWEYEKALQLNDHEAAVYLGLANLYDSQKNRAKALEVVTEGLRKAADPTWLRKKYVDLGGALPIPEPPPTEKPPTEPPPTEAPAAKEGDPAQ